MQNFNTNAAVQRLRFWYKNARPASLPQSLLPALTALALAAGQADFSLILGLLAVLGAALAHLSLNLFDDYFDYRKLKTGFRESLAAQGMRARTAKCPYLTSGQATVDELLMACIGFGAAAVCLGGVVWLFRGNAVVWPALLGLLLGISYSGDPLRLSYRGLGEAVIGVIFGPLLVAGVYIAACGQFTAPALALGVAMGLLVTNILFTHSVLDLQADLYAGKFTLAALLKTPENFRCACALFTFGPFALVLLAILCRWLAPLWLLVLLALPLAVALYRSMLLFMEKPQVRPRRLPWYGPMGDWPKYCAAGLDWFLLRWFLSRNLTTAFGLCCIAASLLS